MHRAASSESCGEEILIESSRYSGALERLVGVLQALKYETVFGPGLFVWHRGVFASLGTVTTTNVYVCNL